jgi:DNA-binding transcriptional regulator YiaG
MDILTLRSLIRSAQSSDSFRRFADEHGKTFPHIVLSAIYDFAYDYTFSCVRTLSGKTQSRFAQEYNIPLRTIENWDAGTRTPPSYVLELLFLAELNRTSK